MLKAFTIDTLRELANSNSFKRGQAYYRDGAVRKLKVTGAVVTARVQGTENYRVEIDLSGRRVKTYCSCPYDFDGVCKHVVAVGLALLDQPHLLAAPALPTDLAGAWAALPDTRKLEFLHAELQSQPALAARFVALLQPGTAVAQSAAPHEPAALAAALAALSFDDDAVPPEDYEAYAYGGYGDFGGYFGEMIAAALEPAAAELERLLEAKDVVGALRYWAAVGRAIGQVAEPAADDFDYFRGETAAYGAVLLDNWAALAETANWPQTLETWPLPPAEAKAVTAWLREEMTGGEPAGAFAGGLWRPLLLALAHQVPVAEKLPKMLSKSWLRDFSDDVVLRAARTCNDDATWTKLAEKRLHHDPKIALELLHFYHNRADALNRRRVAEVALQRWPHEFAAHVLAHFPAGSREPVRLAALRQQCLNRQPDAALLDELRTLLPAKEFDQLLDQLTARYGVSSPVTQLVVQLWHRHGQTDRLLTFFQKTDLLSYPQTAELIGWLTGRYPHECFEVLTNYVEQGVKGQLRHQRGRVMYEAFADWLKAANRVPALRESVRAVVEFLQEQFPSLKLLHSTLKTAGLTSVLPDHLPADLADDLPPETLRKRPGRKPAPKR